MREVFTRWKYQLMYGKAKEILRKLQVRRNTQSSQVSVGAPVCLDFNCDTWLILTWQTKSGITL